MAKVLVITRFHCIKRCQKLEYVMNTIYVLLASINSVLCQRNVMIVSSLLCFFCSINHFSANIKIRLCQVLIILCL